MQCSPVQSNFAVKLRSQGSECKAKNPLYDGLSWSKGDQEEKGESTEHDPMNRYREVESKECGRMKGVPCSERVTVNPVSG